MDRTELRAVQKPLKDRYREEPAAALVTLRAEGKLDEEHIACKVETGRALVEAGMDPALAFPLAARVARAWAARAVERPEHGLDAVRGELAVLGLLPGLGVPREQAALLLRTLFGALRHWHVPLILAALVLARLDGIDRLRTLVLLVTLGLAPLAEPEPEPDHGAGVTGLRSYPAPLLGLDGLASLLKEDGQADRGRRVAILGGFAVPLLGFGGLVPPAVQEPETEHRFGVAGGGGRAVPAFGLDRLPPLAELAREVHHAVGMAGRGGPAVPAFGFGLLGPLLQQQAQVGHGLAVTGLGGVAVPLLGPGRLILCLKQDSRAGHRIPARSLRVLASLLQPEGHGGHGLAVVGTDPVTPPRLGFGGIPLLVRHWPSMTLLTW